MTAAAADLHIHTPRLRRHGRHPRDPRPRRAARPTSTSSRSPTTSGSTPRSPPAHIARDHGPARSRSSSARRSRPAAATCSALFLEERIPPLRSLRSTIAASTTRAGSRSPPIRSCRTRCAPRGSCSGASLADPDPRCRPDALETFNPTALGRPLARPGRPVRGEPRAGRWSATATPTPPSAIGTGWTHVPGLGPRRTCGARSSSGRRIARLVPRRRRPQLSTFGRQLRKYGATRGRPSAAGSSATARGRDLGLHRRTRGPGGRAG